jgi:hypothetical protein
MDFASLIYISCSSSLGDSGEAGDIEYKPECTPSLSALARGRFSGGSIPASATMTNKSTDFSIRILIHPDFHPEHGNYINRNGAFLQQQIDFDSALPQ